MTLLRLVLAIALIALPCRAEIIEVQQARITFAFHFPPELFPGEDSEEARPRLVLPRHWTFHGELDDARLAEFLVSRAEPPAKQFVANQLKLAAKPIARQTTLATRLAEARAGKEIYAVPWSVIGGRVTGTFTIDVDDVPVPIEITITPIVAYTSAHPKETPK